MWKEESMENKVEDPVYVTGHQHPDTDSIASAIGYAFFKRANGINACACRLGEVNAETKYLLDRFGFKEPMLLKDARKTLGEIPLDEAVYITMDTTVRETLQKMHECGRNSFAVVDGNMRMAGYVSKSDLANIGLGDTAAEVEHLAKTPIEDIAKTINGRIVYNDSQTHVNGKVSVIVMSESGVEGYDVKDRIVVVGNDPQVNQALIEKGAGCLIMVWTENIPDNVVLAAKTHHCPLVVSGYGAMNTTRYLLLAPPVKLIMTKDTVCFKVDEYASDAGAKMLKTRFRSYPVVDDEGRLCGYVSRYHILNHKDKKLILVDHNEFSQSVRNIEKAQILEVIDHHRVNDFKTSQPVSFRNEIIGSSATIIATMFRENQMLLTKELAGLLLGAVLSDTLVLQSPTTTEKDKNVAYMLAALADVEIEELATGMFNASAANPDQSIYEMIVQDIKFYDLNGIRTMVSQSVVPSATDMKMREKEIVADMDKLIAKKKLDLLVVCFTSVMEDGSIFYAAGEKAELVRNVFPDKPGETHSLQKHVYSRKKQIMPSLMEALSE